MQLNITILNDVVIVCKCCGTCVLILLQLCVKINDAVTINFVNVAVGVCKYCHCYCDCHCM